MVSCVRVSIQDDASGRWYGNPSPADCVRSIVMTPAKHTVPRMKYRFLLVPILAAGLALPYATPVICVLTGGAGSRASGTVANCARPMPSDNASAARAIGTAPGIRHCDLGQCGVAPLAVASVVVSEPSSLPLVAAALAALPLALVGELAPPLTPPPQA